MAGRNPSPDLFICTSESDSDSDQTLPPPEESLPPWMRSSEPCSAQAAQPPVILISSESESEKSEKASKGACKSDDSEELDFGSPLKTPPKRPRRPSPKKKTPPSYTDLEREIARLKKQVERLKTKINQLEEQLLKKNRSNDELKKRVQDLETTIQKRNI